MVGWTLGPLFLEFLPPPFHPEQFYSFHMLALVRSEESTAKNSLNETILLQMRRLRFEEAE